MTVADLTGEATGDQFSLVVASQLLLAGMHGNRDNQELRILLVEFVLDPALSHLNTEPTADRRLPVVLEGRDRPSEGVVVGGPDKKRKWVLA